MLLKKGNILQSGKEWQIKSMAVLFFLPQLFSCYVHSRYISAGYSQTSLAVLKRSNPPIFNQQNLISGEPKYEVTKGFSISCTKPN